MDYDQVANKIESIDGTHVIGQVHAPDEQYNLYQIRRGHGKKILLSGSVHGNEPAGVFAIIEFFKDHIQLFERDFEFTAFPCVNPWGFQHYTRGNAANLNLNREFRRDAIAEETQLIMPLLEKYVLTLDLHETWPDLERIGNDEPEGKDPSEFYLWETCADHDARIGDKIIKGIEQAGLPVCKWPKIYGDKNNNGVIWYPEDCGTDCYASGTSFDSYLAANHTKQAFTIETPRDWQLEKRILAHILSITTALKERR
jgi:murein peptide amidase A